MMAKEVNIIVVKFTYRNTIEFIERYSVNIEVNLKYNANGIEQNRLIKSAIIFGFSPILLAYGSHIIKVAAIMIMKVPTISQLLTCLHIIKVTMIVIGP